MAKRAVPIPPHAPGNRSAASPQAGRALHVVGGGGAPSVSQALQGPELWLFTDVAGRCGFCPHFIDKTESLNTKGVFLTRKQALLDFLGGAVVKNPPANAGNTGSSPGLGRSRMTRSDQAREPQLLNPRATTTEAWAPRACDKRSHCSPQLEKARAQQRRPNERSQKLIN